MLIILELAVRYTPVAVDHRVVRIMFQSFCAYFPSLNNLFPSSFSVEAAIFSWQYT